MLTQIYIALWLVIATAALGVYVTGNMSVMAVVAFGFVCFGMVFMGMMSVLPTAVHDSLVGTRPLIRCGQSFAKGFGPTRSKGLAPICRVGAGPFLLW